MSPRLPTLAVSAILLALGAACSSSSNSVPTGCSGTTTTLNISVVNDTNEPTDICNATVMVQGPTGGAVTLKPQGAASNCSYIGNVSAGGRYTVTVDAPDYPTTTSSVDVETGCSVMTAVDVMMN